MDNGSPDEKRGLGNSLYFTRLFHEKYSVAVSSSFGDSVVEGIVLMLPSKCPKGDNEAGRLLCDVGRAVDYRGERVSRA